MNDGAVRDPRVTAIHRARELASTSLLRAIREQGPQPSELSLCTRWASLLADEESLLPEGWYQPPPRGISALIGSEPDFGRMSYVSLRHEEIWPRADIVLGDRSLLYAYASPVDRDTSMIGDLGVTLYTGGDARIQDHLATCLEVTARIARFAEVGMELGELYRFAADLIEKASLANETYSTTDQSGGIDIGHTLPWSFDTPTDQEQEALDSGDIVAVARAISRARVFLNADELRRCASWC